MSKIQEIRENFLTLCSFCGGDEYYLVIGPEISICAFCVSKAAEVINERHKRVMTHTETGRVCKLCGAKEVYAKNLDGTDSEHGIPQVSRKEQFGCHCKFD